MKKSRLFVQKMQQIVSYAIQNGYPKLQDGVLNLTQYLKISLDIVLDAKTFDASGKSDF